MMRAIVLLGLGVSIAAAAPVDPMSLVAWEIPPKLPKASDTVDVYAIDMDGSRLLTHLADDNYVGKPINKKLTGRVNALSRRAAYATVAAQLGVDIKPPVLKGGGAAVDLQFAGAPVLDLFRIFADVGRLNIVVHGSLPDTLDLRLKRVPWEAAFAACLSVVGRAQVKAGNVRYVLPKEAKLPPLPKAGTATVSLDVHDGTVAQAIAALREVTAVKLDACESKPFSVRVKRVPLAEALRAITIVSGATLSETTCKTAKLSGSVADARLVAVAEAGTKRAATLERRGETLTASSADKFDIGSGYIMVDNTSLQLYGTLAVPPLPSEEPGQMMRTAALVRIGKGWEAFVEMQNKTLVLIERRRTDMTVDLAGVHADAVLLPLAK